MSTEQTASEMNEVESAIQTLRTYLKTEYDKDHYIINDIRRAVIEKSLISFKREVDETFVAWTGISFIGEEKTPIVSAFKTFKTRADAGVWLRQVEGTEVLTKHSFCMEDGTPKTDCTISKIGKYKEREIQLIATYVRDGMATSKCKVVQETKFAVICEI
jgi:hypothetical protein